jgi:hypothetical protein
MLLLLKFSGLIGIRSYIYKSGTGKARLETKNLEVKSPINQNELTL